MTVATPERQLAIDKGSWTPSQEIFIGTPQSFEKQRYLASLAEEKKVTVPVTIPNAPSTLEKKAQSILFTARQSLNNINKLRRMSVNTPCRIPVPVKSARASLPGVHRTLKTSTAKLQASIKKPLNKQPLAAVKEVEVKATDKSEEIDVEEKLKMLDVLRQKKLLLEQQLLESSKQAKNDENVQNNVAEVVPAAESEILKPADGDFEPSEIVNQLEEHEEHGSSEIPIELRIFEKDETTSPTPAPVDMAQIILQHLNQLSGRELEKLTVINTNANKNYKRPIVYQNVVKQGPEPDSPNTRIVSKLRDENTATNNNNNLTDTETEGVDSKEERGVRWRSRKSLVQIMKTPDHSEHSTRQLRHQGIIKTQNHDFPADITNSPVCIQRISYQQQPTQQVQPQKRPVKTAKSVTPRKPKTPTAAKRPSSK